MLSELIGQSRIENCVHYPSDVIHGQFLGELLSSLYLNELENKKYNTYLSSLIDKMVSNTSVVVNDWNQNKDTYINSTENTSTSSINKITNDFIYYYEKLFRANKIGIPAGVFSGSKLPDRVEGYYSKIYSKDLALEAMRAIENFFVGKKY